MSRLSVCALLLGGLLLVGAPAGAAEPLAAKYLYEGKLSDGEKALEKRLADSPGDDEARFGLGVVQFFRTFERLGASLHKYGLRTTSNFPVAPRELQKLLPENPRPEKLSYEGFRRIVQDAVDDLVKAEATLAGVKDDKVKLPLHVGRIKIDLFGQGTPVSAALLLGQAELKEQSEAANKFLIGFDRGDVSWLRGYCHFLAAWGEMALAVDGQEVFESAAHRFFQNVETPNAFLLEEDRNVENLDRLNSFPLIADAVSLVYHFLNMPVREPKRLKAVLGHLQGTVAQGKEMWKHILAETDDDNEWVPNPKQKGVLRVEVTKEMVDRWLHTLDEVDQVLQGKKLLPFWRGKNPGRGGAAGVNLRKAFTNPPKRIDVVRWVQGTAATPYLEKGTITDLADPRTIAELNRVFGGVRFFGFAFWFN